MQLGVTLHNLLPILLALLSYFHTIDPILSFLEYSGLVVYPEGPLNPSKSTKEMPHCFRAYKQLLSRIK